MRGFVKEVIVLAGETIDCLLTRLPILADYLDDLTLAIQQAMGSREKLRALHDHLDDVLVVVVSRAPKGATVEIENVQSSLHSPTFFIASLRDSVLNGFIARRRIMICLIHLIMGKPT